MQDPNRNTRHRHTQHWKWSLIRDGSSGPYSNAACADPGERTREIYEHIPGYPQPPLIPLPPMDIEHFLKASGIRSTKLTRWLVSSGLRMSGYHRFVNGLPQHLEEVLRTTNTRGPALFAPVIAATLALADDERHEDPMARAATLIVAARQLREMVFRGQLEPDRLGDEVLEMGQYPNLFATSLMIEQGEARIFKSRVTDRIMVAVAGRFYPLEIGAKGAAELMDDLRRIVDRAKVEESPPVGWLTNASQKTQLKIFERMERNDLCRQSLATMRHSLFTLCLDTEYRPVNLRMAAMAAHRGNPGNRWFHSSLQLVVFGNGRACAICNFSAYLDGNTMIRSAAEIQQRAARIIISPSVTSEAKSMVPPLIGWRVDPRWIEKAMDDWRQVADSQPATFTIGGIGRSFFLAHRIDPVPAFIVALGLAAKRLTGRTTSISQFLAMSKFRCMDLVSTTVTTPEVERFIETLAPADLHPAIESQRIRCRTARATLPIDDLISLFVLSRRGMARFRAMTAIGAMFAILEVLGKTNHTPRDIVVSHPEIYPEAPIIGRPGIRLPYVRCFGLHYQIHPDMINITVMPGTKWKIPNETLIAEIERALREIEEIISAI